MPSAARSDADHVRRYVKAWGDLRWFWPRDGRRETLEGAGVSLAKQYAQHGLDMWHEHAQFDDGSVSVEAGLMEMLDRTQSGRLKVFSHLTIGGRSFDCITVRMGRRSSRAMT
jgi:hypothetical protein